MVAALNIFRRRILWRLSAILIILVVITPLKAQTENFYAVASKTTVEVSEQFQLTFTLNDNGNDFQAPSFKEFTVVMGPSTSKSVQFSNGNMSQSVSYTYVLQPKTEGTFKIGSATIKAGGKIYQSNPITIIVSKASAKPQGNQPQTEAEMMGQIAKNLYIKAHVSRTNVYQGEEISVIYKLYVKVSLVNFVLSKIPTLNGFWSQDLEMPKQLELHKEVIDGVEYQTTELKKVILFPQYSGALTIDPIEGESVVRIQKKRPQRKQGYDPFEEFLNDPFFGGGYQDVNFKVKSEPVKITVHPLPANAPESFSGAVGNFSMTALLDKPETKANEPVTLKIKITGKGNLKLIDPPKLKFPPDIESYDPKVSDNITVNKDGVSGSRTFEYLLIPRHAGEYKIAPIEYSYFNADKKNYLPLYSKEFVLKVLKGSAETTSSNAVSGVNKEEIKLLGKDIRFIKNSNPKFTKKDWYFFGSALFYTFSSFPFILFLGFLIYRRNYTEDNASESVVKSKKASRMAKKRLSLGKKYLVAKQNERFHEELSKALWGYISDKLSIPVSDLSRETITEKLKQSNVNEELINKLMALLDHCEFVRYAPSMGSSEMGTTYEQAILIISEIEQQSRTKKQSGLKA